MPNQSNDLIEMKIDLKYVKSAIDKLLKVTIEGNGVPSLVSRVNQIEQTLKDGKSTRLVLFGCLVTLLCNVILLWLKS